MEPTALNSLQPANLGSPPSGCDPRLNGAIGGIASILERLAIRLEKNLWQGYALALLATLLITAARFAIHPVTGHTAQYTLYYFSIVLCTSLAGWRAGTLAALLGAIAGFGLFIYGHGRFDPAIPRDYVQLALYLVTAALVISLGQWGCRQRRRLRHTAGALYDSEQRLLANFENAALGIIEVDADHRAVAVNHRLCQLLGYRSDELLGKSVNELTAPEDRPRSDELNNQLYHRQLDRIDYEKRYLRKDGSPLWVHVTVTAIRHSSGKLLGSIGTVEDISARKAAEQALRESADRFETIANHISQLAWMTDANGWISWYNQRWYDYTGTDFQTVQGWGWTILHHPDHLQRVIEKFSRSLQTGDVWEDTFPLRGKDGQFRWFLSRAIPIRDHNGKLLRWFGTNTDVTELRHAQEQLTAATTSAESAKTIAEEANRAKDHFLAVLSHELRTPLTPVLAAVTMLQEEAAHSPETRENLEVIRRNLEMEARLIDDLLDLTRIARGKVSLDKRPVELCEIIQRAVEVCRPDIEAKGLHFGIDVGPAPYPLIADAGRLQQVFWNLIKNAIKFTPHGGCVGVRCRPDDHGSVLAEVNDSGIGIEPDALGRIFNAFEQAERSVTRRFGGLGLGLTISKVLVELHGGTVEAHSQGKGRGASFRVRLPQAILRSTPPSPSAQLPSPETPSTDPAPRSLRLLLVEDNGDTARIMKRLLTREGHLVQTAADLATALQLIDHHPFDLLLSDLGLPDGTGLDLMRELRARNLCYPGIALSGYGQEQDIAQSRAAGFAIHLVKPATLQQIQDAIAAVTLPPHNTTPSALYQES